MSYSGRYGGGTGGDLGRPGRQLERVLPAVHKGGQAEDAEATLVGAEANGLTSHLSRLTSVKPHTLQQRDILGITVQEIEHRTDLRVRKLACLTNPRNQFSLVGGFKL